MSVTVIYPGAFDPITYGHSDIAARAAKLFDRVIVAVAAGFYKKPMFTLDERVDLAKAVLSGVENVMVCGFDSLLADFARLHKTHVIIRGLRAASDFEYEFQLAGMNHKLWPELETVFLPTSEQYTYISSSLVKEIANLGGAVDQFVAPQISQALFRKIAQ